MSNQKNRFLVVGQGLAGSTLTEFLLRHNQNIVIIDHFSEHTSSKVAGGIINPITGKRLTKSWLAEEIFPFAKTFYTELEKEFNTKFYHEIPISRLFSSLEDENNCMARSAEDEYKQFLSEEPFEKQSSILSPFGGVELKNGGWLDTNTFLMSMRHKFKQLNIIKNEVFNYRNLAFEKEKVKYNDSAFDYIIFCEGFKAIYNPFFDWLPFTLAKGELLEITSDELPNDKMLNKNGFILPISGNKFLAGATFRWNELHTENTERSRLELIDKIAKITTAKYTIVSQRNGVRPTVRDRRPFVGFHPKHKNLGIFNGLGSKGVTLSPYFAEQFVKNILFNEELNPEVNIERYFSLFLSND